LEINTIIIEKAKRALAGCGNYEMTADGELTRLDLGRDGILHIPKECKVISKTFFTDSVYNTDAEIRFCENAEIRIYGNSVLKAKPYNSDKISDMPLDLSYASDIYWSYRLILQLKNVQISYIFSNEAFAEQAAKLYYYFKFSDCIGWKFTEKNGKLAVFIGTTDITEKFCNVNILEDILREFSYEVAEELMQKLKDYIKEKGVEVPDNLLSAKWHIK
jgi:hypothetical protein